VGQCAPTLVQVELCMLAERSLAAQVIEALRVLLRAKFGELDDLDELARRLTDRDHDGNIGRIVAGATLAELRS
jgi:hypothetical protein